MTEPYSTIVYRDKGPYQRPGGTYDWRGVKSREEHDQALKEGWFNSMPEAIKGEHVLIELPPIESPPTRAELEQKAKELGIKFNKGVKDEQLLELIEKALKG